MKNKAYDILLNPYNTFINGNANNAIQKQTITIPADRNYQFLFLELINLVAADIVNLVLRANGSPVQSWASGTDLDLQNQREGLPPSNAIGGGANPILAISQRRDRCFGGALEYLTPPQPGSPFPVGIAVGDCKDQETNTSLNCGSQDPSTKFSINTLTLEVWILAEATANTPSINLTAYGYDPFPGGPGLMKFVDSKQVNIPGGQFTLDKDSAFTIGDGQRLNMEQVLLTNPNNVLFDNLVVYWQTLPQRNRNANINSFMMLLNTLKTNPAGLFALFDSREMLYGDETLPIGALNSAFKIQGTNPGALVSLQLYQVSSGMLVPSNPGVITAQPQ